MPDPATSWHEREEADMDASGRGQGPQDVRGRERAGPGAARRQPDRPVRRVRRADGPVGLRQVDAAQPGRRPRRGRRGHDHRGGRAGDRPDRGRAVPAAAAPHRHRLPVLQPPRGDDRPRERRAARGHRRLEAARWPRPGPATCSTCSASATRRGRCRACSRVASASGSPSPARWPTSRRCCWPTSRPAPSTPRAARRSLSCSAACTPGARRSCS